ncbi:MAG: putative porin [Verrucomicrobia bacterium]|nr:putative porin [Verrucomicrobiota bacterium]
MNNANNMMTKMKTNSPRPALVAAVLATLALGATAHAQTADALIDKLIEKGILTTKEAKDLRDESDKDFTRAFAAKTGMPDWVTALKISGDVRLRYDGIYFDPGAGGTTGVDRNRLRHRTRVGITASLMDDFEVGVRFTSGENKSTGNNGMGDPISGNDSFTFNGSKKLVWLDLAYAKWNALNTPAWSATFIGGKMENPFVFDEVVFDSDYTPEGLAWQVGYNVNDRHALKFNTGLFSLAEVSGSSHDSYLFGAQLRWDAAWSPKWATSVGLSGLAISDKQALTHAAAGVNPNVPDVSRGNTRVSSTGALTSSFNPFIVDAALTYTMESFPKYPGAFPIKLGGEYINNPAASANLATSPIGPNRKRNEAYSVGLQLGKSGKKGTWDLTYKWKNLESNYWFEEVVDSDHGAWYQTSPFTGGGGTGYGAGTNLRGHYMRAAYSPFDSFTLSCSYYLFSLIDKPAGALSSQTGRIQFDAAWKF